MPERQPDRRNALPDAIQPRGRGARSNVSGRFEPDAYEPFDDGWRANDEKPPKLRTRLIPEKPKQIISRNASPDISFDQSINPYQGCEHGCVYCYARPSHAYWGLSPGLDFESRIFVKPNAAVLLRAELSAKGYKPKPIVVGANTDPYQPVEREQALMRDLLAVFAETRHPVSAITKSALITRDIDYWAELARQGLAKIAVSITTLDRSLARQMEPRAATPARRLDAVAALSEAGVPVTVMTAPVVPGLTDHEIEPLLKAAREAGAVNAAYVLLRLPLEIADLFKEWLATARPDATSKVMSLMRQMRGGKDYDSRWGVRQRGAGPYAALIHKRYRAALTRYGYPGSGDPLRIDLFEPPARPGDQPRLL